MASLLVAATAAWSAPAVAQTAKVGVVTTLQGSATVARGAPGEPAPLRFKDDVFQRDRIATGERSLARLLLGGKAVVTVRERSVLSVSEDPGSAAIELPAAGGIAIAVARERMKPGETLQIRTPNAVAGIRGTVVVAEVGGQPGGFASAFSVLQGTVEVTALDPVTRRPVGPSVTVGPLHRASVTAAGVQPPRRLTPQETSRITSDFKAAMPPPGVTAGAAQTEMARAVEHVAGLGDQVSGGARRGGGYGASAAGGFDGTDYSGDTYGSGSSRQFAASSYRRTYSYGGTTGHSGGGGGYGRGY